MYWIKERDLIAAEPQEKRIIRKSCELSKVQQSLKDEIENLAKLRSCLSHNERIMTSLGTITHDGFLHILFPVADYDLDDLLFEKGKAKANNITRDPTTLTKMAIEVACLAEALDYLHYNLRLEDGERSYCIHHDLKPDNILVVLEARGSSVGKWKITDFGLSQFKRSKANGAHGGHDAFEHAPSVRNTLIPSSMTSPKRNPGPFVAPETEKQGQKAVGRESDIWSLGCIWILVMSFMIGGKVGAQEFDRRRGRQRSPNKKSTSYETDYNYRDDGRGGLEVNPDVIAWLDEQKALKSRGDDWLGKGIGLALDMLKIDMKSRPNAKTVQDRLFEVVTSLKSGRQEPLQPVSQTSLVPPQTPQGHDQIQEALVKTMVPLDRKTSWVRTLSGTLGYGDGSASSGPGASNLRSASPVIKEADFVPYPSDILQRPVVESTFVNIKIPDSHIVQTAFSSTNLFVAYLSKTNVYIHSIESLDRSRLWAKGKNKGKVSSETKFQSVRGSGGYQWVSMVLACDLLAVRGSKPDSNSCMVCKLLLSSTLIFLTPQDLANFYRRSMYTR